MQTPCLTFAETSPASAGSAASSQAVVNSTGVAGIASGLLDVSEHLFVLAQLVGATGGTLDVYIQTSPDLGTTWVDWAHFPQLAAGAAAIKYAFTVSKGSQLLTPTVVGVNNSPALAVNTVVGGWGDRFRLWMVAGASTSAGAAVNVKITGSRAVQ